MDPDNSDPANRPPSPDEGSENTKPGQKRLASDLMEGGKQARLGEFGNLDITGVGAISEAAKAVREAMGEDPAGRRSSSPELIPPPEARDTSPDLQEPEPQPVQPSTRIGDISSQFGKLIIDGMQAVSGAFRQGKRAENKGHQPVQQAQPAPVPAPESGSNLSDRFTKAIMDKFRAIVDSRWQDQFRVDRDGLIAAIERLPHPVVREEIQRNMASFERRAHSQKLDISQIKNTYRSVLFLIENLRCESCLDDSERLLLGMQVLRLAAYPEQVTAGGFPTSDIVSLETKIYSDSPSAAAHLIAETALYNTYMSQQGLQITLPGDDLHPDHESRDPVGNNGLNRSYASQLFQQVALNVHYIRHGAGGMQARYRINPENDSEELIALDGRRFQLDSSTRSIDVHELFAEIAGGSAIR